MNRDILLGVSCSLLVHGFVLWIGAHLQHEASMPVRIPAALNLSIVRHSIPKAASQAPTMKTTPLSSRPELVMMHRMTPRKAMVESVTPTRRIHTLNTVRKKASPQTIPAPDPVRDTEAIFKKLRVPKKIPKKTAPEKSPATEPTMASVALPVRQTIDRPRPMPSEGRGGQLASLRDSPVTLPGPTVKDKEEGGPTGEASLPVQGDPPIIEAVPDYAVNPKPVYPKLAIRRNYQGTVILLVEVLGDGSVKEVEIFESSGYSVLDRSAQRAVRRWRFKPGTRYGEPAAMEVKVPVVFRLKGQGAG